MNTLLAVLGAIVCALLAALFIYVRVAKGGLLGVYTKILASFGFIVLGLLLSINKITFGTSFDVAAIFICIGLVCGMIGDIVLDLKVVYRQDENTHLPMGMLAFGVGHIFYIIAMMVAISTEAELGSWNFVGMFLLDVLITLILTVVTWYVSTKFMNLNFKKHLWPTMIYTFILIFTLIFALTFAIAVPAVKLWIMTIGLTLFLASDLVLSLQYFGGRQTDTTLTIINHTLYYTAQIVIALFIFSL